MPKPYAPKGASAHRKSPYSKPNNKKPSTDREEKQRTSINDLKRRIRDVKRLLNMPDLSADKRIIQERALMGYEKELADEEKRRERSNMITKYHFVRFLDRKTATKEVSKLTRKRDDLIESTPESSKLTAEEEAKKKRKLAKLQARLHIAKVNLNYTIYYPLTEKYISIYADKKKAKRGEGEDQEEEVEDDEEGADKDEKDSKSNAERKAMWSVVEKCMADGTLDLLREGKLRSGGEVQSQKAGAPASTSRPKKESGDKKSSSKEKSKPSKSDARRTKTSKHDPSPANEDEGDSDGGFFEM
ncbi:hypothetical protein BJY04DRAFT_190115 [Aspergillus karnatakaensis]|uniref:Efg1 domain-containing protein n=1 Tax=Aspergillus karnatakaensis TaxID=1810916 RepID=UPI003CCD6D41